LNAGQLIKLLQQVSPLTLIIIEDAETNWFLNITKVYERQGKDTILIIQGDYRDEYDPD